MNLLAGEEKAIVTDIAGTTRDVLEENLVLKGISLRILDTAGIRKTADTVEKIGVDRALEHAKDADLILYVVDASVPLDENDAKIMEILKGRKAIVLLNKSDLTAVIERGDGAEDRCSGHQHFGAGRDGHGRAGRADEKDVLPR